LALVSPVRAAVTAIPDGDVTALIQAINDANTNAG
jgi:hypothetical protein